MPFLSNGSFVKDTESTMPGETNIYDVLQGLVTAAPGIVQAATGKEIKPFEVQFGVAGSAQRTALIGAVIVAVAVAAVFLMRR